MIERKIIEKKSKDMLLDVIFQQHFRMIHDTYVDQELNINLLYHKQMERCNAFLVYGFVTSFFVDVSTLQFYVFDENNSFLFQVKPQVFANKHFIWYNITYKPKFYYVFKLHEYKHASVYIQIKQNKKTILLQRVMLRPMNTQENEEEFNYQNIYFDENNEIQQLKRYFFYDIIFVNYDIIIHDEMTMWIGKEDSIAPIYTQYFKIIDYRFSPPKERLCIGNFFSGWVKYTILKEIYEHTKKPTGKEKDNISTDPHYIPPFFDSNKFVNNLYKFYLNVKYLPSPQNQDYSFITTPDPNEYIGNLLDNDSVIVHNEMLTFTKQQEMVSPWKMKRFLINDIDYEYTPIKVTGNINAVLELIEVCPYKLNITSNVPYQNYINIITFKENEEMYNKKTFFHNKEQIIIMLKKDKLNEYYIANYIASEKLKILIDNGHNIYVGNFVQHIFNDINSLCLYAQHLFYRLVAQIEDNSNLELLIKPYNKVIVKYILNNVSSLTAKLIQENPVLMLQSTHETFNIYRQYPQIINSGAYNIFQGSLQITVFPEIAQYIQWIKFNNETITLQNNIGIITSDKILSQNEIAIKFV